MLPHKHIVIGFFVSLLLFFLVPSLDLIEATVFFLASFLIDFDHYIYFVYKKKSFDLKSAYKYFREKGKKLSKKKSSERENYYTGIYVFHGIEPVLIVTLLGYFFNSIFYAVSFGMLFHLIVDLSSAHKKDSYPKKFSLIYDVIKSRKKKLI